MSLVHDPLLEGLLAVVQDCVSGVGGKDFLAAAVDEVEFVAVAPLSAGPLCCAAREHPLFQARGE
jgi:hypothetical protein